MAWNWQRKDRPAFQWDVAALERLEQQLLLGSGIFLGATQHLSDPQREALMIERLSDEAMTTSEIEGELLDRASVRSSLRKHLGRVADSRRVTAAEQGVAEMMVGLYRTYDEPLKRRQLYDDLSSYGINSYPRPRRPGGKKSADSYGRAKACTLPAASGILDRTPSVGPLRM